MALAHSPSIVRNGLILHLDAANPKSYPGTGTAWTDISGQSNTGTMIGGVGYSSTNSGSFVFDGTDDYVQVNNTNGFGISGLSARGSLEIWANITRRVGVGSVYQQLAGFRNDSDFNFFFLLLDSGGPSVLTEARFGTASGIRDINVNYISYFDKWTHIVFTASTDRTDLYFNGVLAGSNTNSSTTLGANSGNFRIGQSPGGEWPTLGNISKVAFYNRTLTIQEVRQNFEALRGRYGI